jgi:hypothetical protein
MTDLKYYDLEHYLLEEVGPRLDSSGVIEPISIHDLYLEGKSSKDKNQRQTQETG